MTLTEFLMARIAEDEAVARRTAERMEHAPPAGIGGVGNLGIVGYPFARVLAECEAKRRIIEMCAEAPEQKPDEQGPWVPNRLLCVLALPHAGHPHYDEEWRA